MILLKNGDLIDGTGSAPRRADVLIEGTMIQDVGTLDHVPDAEVVDCQGLAICPGFIDVHSHGDLEALQHRDEKICQGVTTEVVGNCGFSLFPNLPLENLVPSFEIFKDREGRQWDDAESYFDDIEKQRSHTHLAALTGHSSLRAHVTGMRADKLEGATLRQAESVLTNCMEQGSIGLSTGLNEVPSSYGDLDELVKLCGIVRRYDGFYTSHLRDYKFHIVEAVEEALEIGRRTGVPVQLSHLQTVGRKNWDKMDKILNLVDRAVNEGVDVGIDAYPYLAGSCNLTQFLPVWALEGGTDALLERLTNVDTYRQIATETEENMSNDWEDILLCTVPGQGNLIGQTVRDIAESRKNVGVDTALDLLIESNGRLQVISFNQSEENLRKVLSHPRTAVITDGLVVEGKSHPRTFGTYPKFFGEYVRDKGWMALEEAVWKATGLPAQRFGLAGRGIAAAGNWADLVVFSPEKIGTQATYENPDLAPEGIEYVIVNGHWALRHGIPTEGLAGTALRHRA